ncbi:MAG: CRTAC1 family protein, partial [Chitinophagaceae bacterium]|nr:CRTAC1 family protein [Chitinophagaceae bacterium]
NGDGRLDLVLGNIGENFYLSPDIQNPAKLWRNDYDGNEYANTLLSYTIHGRDMPVFLKNDLQDQLPSIKKQNLKHKDYAEKSVQDLFSKELIRTSSVRLFNYPSSCIAINLGDGRFEIRKLPVMSQLSCINAFLPLDVDGNGTMDLVTGGNQFGFLPQFEKLDANFGEVLLNDGKGNFTWQDVSRTGLTIRGEVRAIFPIAKRTGRSVIFVLNNDRPLLYSVQSRR